MNTIDFHKAMWRYSAWSLAGLMTLGLIACGGGGGGSGSTTSASSGAMLRFQSVDGIAPSIPQYMMATVAGSFALNASSTATISTVTWDFGDGTTASTANTTHVYANTGSYTVSVNATDSTGKQMSFTQTVTVVAFSEAYTCLADLAVTVPSVATVGTPFTASLSVPSCMNGEVTQVVWNFGNGSTASGTSTTFTYAAAGTFNVTTAVYLFAGTTPSFTYTSTIYVTSNSTGSGSGTGTGTGTGSGTGTGTGSGSGSGTGTGTGTGSGSGTGTGTGSGSGSGTGTGTGSGTGSGSGGNTCPVSTTTETPSPHGMYCRCRHHYHWDRDFVTSDDSQDADDARDWGHDCKEWFDDHSDWFHNFGSWDHDDDASAQDTSADQNRCEDHGHHGWDQDCDDWYNHRNDPDYSRGLRLKPVINSMAWEDLYYPANTTPNTGVDYDYNDFLTEFVVSETADSNNNISTIDIDFYPRAVGAGYDHQLLLVLDGLVSGQVKNSKLLPQTKPLFNGSAQVTVSYDDDDGHAVGSVTHPKYNQDIVLFPSTHAVFDPDDGNSNNNGSIIDTVADSDDFSGSTAIDDYNRPKLFAHVHIVLDDPCLNPAPKDGRVDASGLRVILQPKPTDYDIDIIDVDAHNFTKDGLPWGFIIPTDWQWMQEGVNINNGYPLLKDYAQHLLGNNPTDGSDYMHWYNYPVNDTNHQFLYPLVPAQDVLPLH